MPWLRKLIADEQGATLVETTIVFSLLTTLMFGLVDFGNAFWQYHTTEKATYMGARWVATQAGLEGAAALGTELYTTTVPDCFDATGTSAAVPGTPCSQVSGATAWSATCTGTGGGNCSSTRMAALLAVMQQYAPALTASNIRVQFQGSALGFVGRGRAVPLVTVTTSGLTYNFVAVGALLGLSPITMPSFATTLPAEDQREGPAV
jgi:Flp pilus assembly protein TadG